MVFVCPRYMIAYDCGLISILPDYEIVLSKELKEYRNEIFYNVSFAPIEHTKILLHEEHRPNPVFLQYHMENIFAAHN